ILIFVFSPLKPQRIARCGTLPSQITLSSYSEGYREYKDAPLSLYCPIPSSPFVIRGIHSLKGGAKPGCRGLAFMICDVFELHNGSCEVSIFGVSKTYSVIEI